MFRHTSLFINIEGKSWLIKWHTACLFLVQFIRMPTVLINFCYLIILDIVPGFFRFCCILCHNIVINQSSTAKQAETSWTAQNTSHHMLCGFLKPMANCIFKLLVPNHESRTLRMEMTIITIYCLNRDFLLASIPRISLKIRAATCTSEVINRVLVFLFVWQRKFRVPIPAQIQLLRVFSIGKRFNLF